MTKRIRGHRLCFGASILLVTVFFINLVREYMVYTTTLNSAPFCLWVVVDGLFFLLPALALLFVGLFLKKRVIRGI